MFSLILMNLVVSFTAALLVKYLFCFKSILDYFITFFILYFTQIVLSLQLLGILKVLSLNNVLLLNLLALLIVYLTVNITKIKPKDNLQLKFRSIINNLKFNKVETLCLSVILGFGLVKILINLVNSPFGWDSLNYHFTFPVEWLKHGNLDNPISPSGDPAVSYYPINGSLFFLWFILPLKNVFIADLGQASFFIIAFFAVYSLARKLDLSKEYALFSASIFTLIPNYFKQLEIAYVDIMVVGLFLAALNYLFMLNNKNKSIQNIILCSISLGLMLGTKTTALTLACLLFIPVIYLCFSNFTLRRSCVTLGVSLLLIIFTGGFGYIRNIFQTGNPLYPLDLKLFNYVIFKGVVDNEIYRTAIRPGDFNLSKILFSEGLGAQTIIFLLPAIFLGFPLTIIKMKKSLNFNLIYFMLLPILLILIFRFINPIPNLRYIYALFGIGFIIAFYLANLLRIPRVLLRVLIVICVFASIAELAGHLELISSIIISIVLFCLLPCFLIFIKRKESLKFLIISLCVICLLIIFLEKDYVKNEYKRYVEMADYSGFWPDATKAWFWLNQNTIGNNIAYTGRPTPFPLYGTNFKNNIYYVSVNKIEPAMLHYYLNSKYIWGYIGDKGFQNFEDDNNYRGKANYDTWVNNLSRRDIDYLFIYSYLHRLGTPFPMEDMWAISHPNKFELVLKNDTIHIYRIIK